MNCHKMERMVLLAESGELTRRKHAKVAAHVARCPSCSAFGADVRQLMETAPRSIDADRGLSPFILTRIKAYGREALERKPILLRHPALQTAVVLILVVLAGWWSVVPSGKEATGASRLREMHALMEVMTDREYPAAQQPAMSEEEMLRTLAERLLEMEGLAEEELSVEEWLAPPSTVPQSHNSPASSSQTCG